jgi:MFS family permease
MPAGASALASGIGNPAVRRVLLAFIGFSLAEWASWIAILVFAYRQGGPTETGNVALVQLGPSALVAPLAASVGDRVQRGRALRFAYLVQAAAMGATAGALLLSAPNWTIYLAAATAASSITLTRPIQAAILPSLARTPAELTAANVGAGSVETLSMLVGPILAGLALATSSAGFVFLASAVVTALGAVLVSGLHHLPWSIADHAHGGQVGGSGGIRRAFRDTADGLAMLAREERPRSVLVLLGAGAMLWGAIDVLLVVLAIDVLSMGDAGVGYLNAAMGLGGLLGAAASVLLIGRHRLAAPLALGMGLWALALAGLGLAASPIGALLLLAVAGVGHFVADVAGRTLLQRVAPERMLARVFGVLEGVQMASLALGSVIAAALVGLLAAHGAFVAAGGGLALAVLAGWPQLRRVDAAGLAHPGELALLRAIPMFAPLPAPALERLAASLVPVTVPAGQAIIREGERGDRFYIIVDGEVEVSRDGALLRREGPGESFGEIALLRSIPRTASVTARVVTRLVTLERRIFLETITGQPASSAAAEMTVSERMQEEPAVDAGS